MSNLKKLYNDEISKKMKESFGYSNINQIPKIEKVSINVGAGAAKDSADLLTSITNDLTSICGQKPRINKSRISVSGFKLREGQTVGTSVTLRGKMMYDFIERLISVSLPRIRDFRGLSVKSFDHNGNYSIGIKEHTIFPEIKFDKVKETFGLQVNISTSAKSDEECMALLSNFGFPFEKKALGKSNTTNSVETRKQNG